MKVLGIDFAPLSIPKERRFQTLGVLHFTYNFLFLGFGMLFLFIYLSFTSLYYLVVIYMAWFFYDYNTSVQGGRRCQSMRRWRLFKATADYFPAKLIKTQELHPAKNYIFVCHPHGVMCHSHFINFATEGTGFSDTFPGIRPYLCALNGQFFFPIFREYFMLTGAISVSSESLEWVFTKEGTGNAVAIMVGGAVEALEASPGNFNLKLKSRRGFVRLALKHGVSLVPVYAFGENTIYEQVPNPSGSSIRKLQNFMTRYLGFSPPLFHGRGIFNYTFGLLPYRKPVNTVVGAPISVERVPEPTKDEIEALHTEYCKALNDLFEEHKMKYGLKEDDHLKLI